MTSAPEDLLVLAGAGSLPRLVLQGARAAGVRRLGALGIRGTTAGSTLAAATDWRRRIPLRSLAALRDAVRESGFRHAILAGQINPLSFFRAAFDPELRDLLLSISLHNAHTIFGRLVDELAALGVETLPSSLFLAPHIPGVGPVTARRFSDGERAAAEYGSSLALALGDLDIGQTVVVKDGVALAVEGFDGTNATILRGGRIARRGAVVAKAAKHGHDMRFDIPVIGVKTLKAMRKARCTALAVQAGRAIFIDLPLVARTADKWGIAIEALDSGLPAAPTI